VPVIQTRRRLVAYETFGAGRIPILLVHGNFGSSRWWRALGRCLPPRFTAHAPDLPGFAGSPLGHRRVTIATLAEDLIDFADALGLDRFHLVGHSLGTAVSMQLAHLHPERVASLMLLAPVPAGGIAVLMEKNAKLAAFDLRKPFSGSLLELLNAAAQWLGLHRRALQRTLMRMAPTIDRDPDFQGLIDDAAAMTPRAIVEMFDALVRFDPALAGVTAPTLVIAGEEDPLIPIHHARELAKRLPCAMIRGYAGVAHGVPVEAPEAVARSLARFVRYGRWWLAWRRWLCSAIRPS